MKFVGYMKLSGNDGEKRVYFDEEAEDNMEESGFLYFICKDYQGKTEFLLVNPVCEEASHDIQLT